MSRSPVRPDKYYKPQQRTTTEDFTLNPRTSTTADKYYAQTDTNTAVVRGPISVSPPQPWPARLPPPTLSKSASLAVDKITAKAASQAVEKGDTVVPSCEKKILVPPRDPEFTVSPKVSMPVHNGSRPVLPGSAASDQRPTTNAAGDNHATTISVKDLPSVATKQEATESLVSPPTAIAADNKHSAPPPALEEEEEANAGQTISTVTRPPSMAANPRPAVPATPAPAGNSGTTASENRFPQLHQDPDPAAPATPALAGNTSTTASQIQGESSCCECDCLLSCCDRLLSCLCPCLCS